MNSQYQQVQISHPNGKLSGLCFDALMYVRSLPKADRVNRLGFLDFQILDMLERAVGYVLAIKSYIDTIQSLLNQATSAQLSDDQAGELQVAYSHALDTAFPTRQAYLNLAHKFHGVSQDHNLASISLSRLTQLEEASLADGTLNSLLNELREAFKRIKNLDDSQGFRQAFEVYGEALVYSILNAKFKTAKIAEKSTSMPDFSCKLPNGKEFFVEVKSLDIVDGPYRSKQMHDDAMQHEIKLESQINRGALIATAEREIAPYMRAFPKPGEYDAASLLTVINTLIDKARSAFKSPQFKQGPTFAFALCDRLMLPGGKHSVAPHYYERGGSAVVSGSLWHACFGKTGWPISRLPNFDGSQGIEGYMCKDGLLSDLAVSFPSGAIIFAETNWQEDNVLGLYDPKWEPSGDFWTADDTQEVMHTLCTAVNDRMNSYGQLVDMT